MRHLNLKNLISRWMTHLAFHFHRPNSIRPEHRLSRLCDATTGDIHDNHSMDNAARIDYPKKRHHQPAIAAGIEIRAKSDA
jgi:hypothetical protein